MNRKEMLKDIDRRFVKEVTENVEEIRYDLSNALKSLKKILDIDGLIKSINESKEKLEEMEKEVHQMYLDKKDTMNRFDNSGLPTVYDDPNLLPKTLDQGE